MFFPLRDYKKQR